MDSSPIHTIPLPFLKNLPSLRVSHDNHYTVWDNLSLKAFRVTWSTWCWRFPPTKMLVFQSETYLTVCQTTLWYGTMMLQKPCYQCVCLCGILCCCFLPFLWCCVLWNTNTQTVLSRCLLRHTEPLSNVEQWSYTSSRAGLWPVLVHSKDTVSAAG